MNEVSMLETLKKEFLGMSYEVEYEKYGLSGMLDFVPYEVHCEAPLRTGWANVIYKCNKDTDNYSMLIKDLQTATPQN